MKNIFASILVVLLISPSIVSQNKKLTVEDGIIGEWRQFYPERLWGLQAYGDNAFTHVKNFSEIYVLNSSGKEVKLPVDLKQINETLKYNGFNEIRGIPYYNYKWLNTDQFSFQAGGNFYVYNIKTNQLDIKTILPKDADHISFKSSINLTAYTVKNNIYLTDSEGRKTAVTNDENSGIVNGSAYTHRQEFGIDRGIFWSPKGNYLAFYKKDETMVPDYPLVDITTRIAELKTSKYPMIGEKSEEVTLGIYNIKTGKTIFTDVTDFTAERFLTSVTWGPEEKYIYIGVLNRGQDHFNMNKYDALTGKFIKTLFTEKNDRYVEPEHQLIFIEGLNDQFIWFSERDGYNHLYLYNTEGKLIKQLTKGKWVVKEFHGFDNKLKNFFISSTMESPLEDHMYRINFKTGDIKKLTKDPGMHHVVFSNSKKYFYDSYSNTGVPNSSSICDVSGKIYKEIITAKYPFTEYDLGEMKIGKIKAADEKTDLYYRMITPPNFDPSKKYPVLVYVYGGPHNQMVTNSWLGGARLWQYYFAQEGYIVFTMDNRGTDNRGFDFESVIHGQIGEAESADQMKGIEFLKSLPYTDHDRFGLHGWSYGGFMTVSMMLNYPETFKVGVAGGPVIDWKYYEVMYGERYMDTYQENPEGFEKIALMNKAEKLKGKLMIIHGYQDNVVLPQISLLFLKSCIEAGKDIDFFFYPESEHNMRGQTRVHLYEKVSRYFDDFLK